MCGWCVVLGAKLKQHSPVVHLEFENIGMTLKTNGNVQGAASDRVANFHEDLAAAKFAEQVERKSDPVWSLEEDDDRIPAAYLRFPVDMQFRPTVTKKK